jgi:hypothetical protein
VNGFQLGGLRQQGNEFPGYKKAGIFPQQQNSNQNFKEYLHRGIS